MRFVSFAFLILFILACDQQVNEATYKGTWIDKDLLARKNSDSSILADTSARFPLILFEKEQADSVLFYYNKEKIELYESQYAYDSYFFHFDKYDEYFFAYDYKTDEIIFSNLRNDEFYRFVKIDTLLSRKEVMNPDFDIDSFIQTVK